VIRIKKVVIDHKQQKTGNLFFFPILSLLSFFPFVPASKWPSNPAKGFGEALLAGEKDICSHETRSLGFKCTKMRAMWLFFVYLEPMERVSWQQMCSYFC